MSVSDNGCGFKNDVPSGIGFTSLRTRANLLNAQLNIDSDANGTRVALTVPLSDPTNRNPHR
jgi:signal transduction histidine kinase